MTRRLLLATAATCALIRPAWADDVGKVFNLGEVVASAPTDDGPSLGGSTVTQDDLRQFDRNSLDKAMTLVPGATVSEVGGRNESDVWIRGFDRWRVPLYIDGIPVYLPADNRIDFSRFTTADIAEIQVTKGFTSVIDGPGALGGSINLVSRQVTKPFEGDARLGSSFDQTGAFNGFTTDLFTGTKQDKFYVQIAGTENYKNHWRLSDDYTAGPFENGGNRNQSDSNDYKINFKAGLTPRDGDEYSINVIDQVGQKDTPPPDDAVPASAAKFWTWPAWDKQSVYWLSQTGIDDRGSTVKTRVYYDRFYNVLDIWDDVNYNTMTSTSAEISTYDDRAIGGSVELSEQLFHGQDNVKAALHYRWDEHKAQNDTNINTGQWLEEPTLRDSEATYSAALENTFHPTKDWDLTLGASYDYRQMLHAEDFDTLAAVHGTIPSPYGYMVNYPLSDKHAVNSEAAVAYHYAEGGVAHVSVSDRTRFPTLFEMYSSKFGTSVGNPYLLPESSINYEAGVSQTFGGTKLGANVFLSHMMDAIESVSVYFPALGKSYNQSQNVGAETHRGFELEASTPVTPTLDVGGNYSFLYRQVLNHIAVATDTPRNKVFTYANWRPVEGLSVVPSVELDGKRWLQSAANTSYYYYGGDAVVANLKAAYDLTHAVQVEAGVNNLFDVNYVIEDGYNAEGRNFFTNVRVKF